MIYGDDCLFKMYNKGWYDLNFWLAILNIFGHMYKLLFKYLYSVNRSEIFIRNTGYMIKAYNKKFKPLYEITNT